MLRSARKTLVSGSAHSCLPSAASRTETRSATRTHRSCAACRNASASIRGEAFRDWVMWSTQPTWPTCSSQARSN